MHGIHEDDLEWYVILVVSTHASLKSGIMETVACEQQSDDQSVYTTDGITYTMPVLYGHSGAVDNTQTQNLRLQHIGNLVHTNVCMMCTLTM